MTKENKSLKVKTSSRRKFFKTAAKTGAIAAAAVAMPYVKANAATTLKMQAAWPSGATSFSKWLETIVTWLKKCLEDLFRLIFNRLEQL